MLVRAKGLFRASAKRADKSAMDRDHVILAGRGAEGIMACPVRYRACDKVVGAAMGVEEDNVGIRHRAALAVTCSGNVLRVRNVVDRESGGKSRERVRGTGEAKDISPTVVGTELSRNGIWATMVPIGRSSIRGHIDVGATPPIWFDTPSVRSRLCSRIALASITPVELLTWNFSTRTLSPVASPSIDTWTNPRKFSSMVEGLTPTAVGVDGVRSGERQVLEPASSIRCSISVVTTIAASATGT